MATIDKAKGYFTIIIVFTVKAENANEILNINIKATEGKIQEIDGYVSCNFHLSEDKTKIAEYVQWKSKAHFEAMMKNPEATEHIEKTMALVENVERTFYDVVWSD